MFSGFKQAHTSQHLFSFGQGVILGAMSDGQSSRQLMAALLQKARQEGLDADGLSGLFSELTAESFANGFEFIPEDGEAPGAMTDGAKRRFSAESAGTNVTQNKPKQVQVVHLPSMQVDPKRLPEGIPSLEKWSKCCLEFGRYGGDGMSYADLVDSKSPEHQSYVKWVKDNPKKSKDPRFIDFYDFLKLHEEMISAKTPGGCFPGSTIVRNFKD